MISIKFHENQLKTNEKQSAWFEKPLRFPALILCVMLILLTFVSAGLGMQSYASEGGAGGDSDAAGKAVHEYSKLSDFDGKRIGVGTGMIQGPMVEEQIPTAELLYYNTVADMITALRQGRVDAIALPVMIIRFAQIDNEDLAWVEEGLNEPTETGAIFAKNAKGDALREEFNEFLAERIADGTMNELDEIWYGKDESRKVVGDPSDLPAEKGTLRVATDSSSPPAVYISHNNYVGIDMDLLYRFCEARGYGLEINDMIFSGIVDSVSSGKCDLGIGCIARTEERMQSVNYSDTIYAGASVLGYLSSDSGAASGGSKAAGSSEADGSGGSFFGSLKESFEKTFIREDRWKLFMQGIGTTLLITALAILFGTLLGFCVFMVCRKGNRAANRITDFFVWLINGMPVVVLLMIFYYVVFGQLSVSGTAVSVIAFTLIFASAVYGMLVSSVGAVDRGQTEAAYALGYTDRNAFFRVVLPQALPLFMPAYKGQITALIKATAIVGYVAVQDLTKMGDIVRSRTYEAFFPLVAVAVIYFILAGILTFFVNRIELRVDPKRRTREDIMKGIDTKGADIK